MRTRIRGPVLVAVSAVVALCISVVCLAAPGNPTGSGTRATVSHTTTGSTSTGITVHIKVENNSDKYISDFHLKPPEGEKFDTSGLSFQPTSGFASAVPGQDGVHWVATATGIPPASGGNPGVATFSVRLPVGATLSSNPMDWVTTTNKKRKYEDDDVHDTGPTTNDPDDADDDDGNLPSLPLASLRTDVEPDDGIGEVAIGSVLSLTLQGHAGGLEYMLCHSEGECPVMPTPASWGLAFTGLDGTLDAGGNATANVTVPNDPTLVGSSFFVLLKTGAPGQAKTNASGPVSITIVAP